MQEAVTDVSIQLQKVLARKCRIVTPVVLRCPKTLQLAEKTARVIIVYVEGQLLKRGALILIHAAGRCSGDIHETATQIGLTHLVTAAERPFSANELAEANSQGFFREVQALARGPRSVRHRKSGTIG